MKTTATATVKLTIKGVEHELTLDEARDVVKAIEGVLPKPSLQLKFDHGFRDIPRYALEQIRPGFKENDIICRANH